MPATSSPPLELRAGELRLVVRPDLGGCIAGLWHGATPILRSAEPQALDIARKAACYPLVPYSNRLAWRRFRWQGQDYTTQPNFDDSPHSVHGVGWIRPWQVVSASGAGLTIAYRHPGDADWPFPFDVSQQFDLTPQALSVRMAVTNTWSEAQPVGLGWHPYFEKRRASRLQIPVAGRWDADADELPAERVAQPGIAADVAALDYDNCFDGFTGTAQIEDDLFRMQLTSPVDYLVVFTPHDRPYFCVEPVSHLSNAIQMADPAAHGLRILASGERFVTSFELRIAPAASA